MRFFRRLAVLLRECVRPGSLDDDVAEELRFHLERQIEENMRAGMAAGDARRAAHLTIGHLQTFREESRSARAVIDTPVIPQVQYLGSFDAARARVK